jgi:hypothetical protein
MSLAETADAIRMADAVVASGSRQIAGFVAGEPINRKAR